MCVACDFACVVLITLSLDQYSATVVPAQSRRGTMIVDGLHREFWQLKQQAAKADKALEARSMSGTVVFSTPATAEAM